VNEWVWSIGGMVLTGENWSTGRETLYSVGGRWMNVYGALMKWCWQGKPEALVSVEWQGQFLRWGVVSNSPNPQARSQPLVGCRRLFIQYIRIYPPYWRPFFHPRPEDAPCRGDRWKPNCWQKNLSESYFVHHNTQYKLDCDRQLIAWAVAQGWRRTVQICSVYSA